MKETPVEWLFEKLWDEPKDKFTWYALRAKAKKMEREISDEEIDLSGIKMLPKIESSHRLDAFKMGAKWYREQIKKQK